MRYRSIDALRGVAATAVMAFHYEALLDFQWPNLWPDTARNFFHLGLTGVELFFVISGFVILLTLDRATNSLHFLIGRVARIYPAYIVSVVLSALFLFSIGAATPIQAVINLTLLQKFMMVEDLIPPYWTLAYELLFYFVMACVVALGLLRNIDYFAIAWLVLAYAVRISHIDLHALKLEFLTMIKFGHLFIAGMMLYRLVSGYRSVPVFVALALAVGYSAFGRDEWWARIPPLTYFLLNGAYIASVWCAAITALQPPRWLVESGEYSYSLYLLHLPIALVLVWLADQQHVPRLHAIIVACPLTFAASFLSRRFIEIPGQEALTRILIKLAGKRHAFGLKRPAI
ncbi:acyltransferase [Bradyrhizobium sp. C-145]|uniref:acyltransferase family protein n=1 Tax=Bradyrhizobium sp. C-145 TaxID=574727 RepID=UPI00201B7BB1|nr:acyltransferase [Bradyrhizobium sp. C-145]UQR65383.1 acyltransferase [Bradyrhizobium sp. C-145]